MPIPTWPAIPYRPTHNGFQNKPVSAVKATEMEAGNKRQRRFGTIPRYRQTISLRMTEAEVETFKDFHENDLDMGASPFTFQVYRTGVGFQSKTVIMVGGDFDESREDRLTRITFEIETQD